MRGSRRRLILRLRRFRRSRPCIEPGARRVPVAARNRRPRSHGPLERVVDLRLFFPPGGLEDVVHDFVAIARMADADAQVKAGQFPEGSMGPKSEASLEFLERGGESVLITSPERLAEALAGRAGTWIVP